jgi:hypothetical protein
VRTGIQNRPRRKPSYKVGLGNKTPFLDKLMQLIGIVLLYLVGLCGSEDIYARNIPDFRLHEREEK